MLEDVVRSIARQWKVLVIVALVISVAATVLGLIWPNRYTATASVTVEAIPTVADVAPDVNMETQRLLARSTEVLSIADDRLGDTSVPALRGQLEVTVPRGSQVLEFHVTTGDAERSAEVADAIATAYLDQRTAAAEQRIVEASDSLASTAEELRTQLAALAPDNPLRESLDGQIRALDSQRAVLIATTIDAGSLIDPAAPPLDTDTPGLYVFVGAGVFLGLLVGAFAALIGGSDVDAHHTAVAARRGFRTRHRTLTPPHTSSTICTVERMCCGVEAPNTRARICGRSWTHVSASRGGIAPDANTDIATGRKTRDVSTSSYACMPPETRNPSLFRLVDTIGSSMPARSSASRAIGRFIVMKPGSAPYRERTCSAKIENAASNRRPSSRSTTTFCRNTTGVESPWNIFISASTSSVMSPSMSLLASDLPPRIAALMNPSSGRKLRRAPDHAEFGDGVRVLVGVRHARQEGEAGITARDARAHGRRPRAMRSCVVHMNERTPASTASSMTSMIAEVSWNRSALAWARSSDMWLTPKNWLSPEQEPIEGHRDLLRPMPSSRRS